MLLHNRTSGCASPRHAHPPPAAPWASTAAAAAAARPRRRSLPRRRSAHGTHRRARRAALRRRPASRPRAPRMPPPGAAARLRPAGWRPAARAGWPRGRPRPPPATPPLPVRCAVEPRVPTSSRLVSLPAALYALAGRANVLQVGLGSAARLAAYARQRGAMLGGSRRPPALTFFQLQHTPTECRWKLLSHAHAQALACALLYPALCPDCAP